MNLKIKKFNLKEKYNKLNENYNRIIEEIEKSAASKGEMLSQKRSRPCLDNTNYNFEIIAKKQKKFCCKCLNKTTEDINGSNRETANNSNNPPYFYYLNCGHSYHFNCLNNDDFKIANEFRCFACNKIDKSLKHMELFGDGENVHNELFLYSQEFNLMFRRYEESQLNDLRYEDFVYFIKLCLLFTLIISILYLYSRRNA